MYLHSASRLTGKFTLDVCISKCVCMRARAPRVCVRAFRARMCVHSFMCLTTVDVFVRFVSVYPAHIRHGCEHPGMYEFMRVSVF